MRGILELKQQRGELNGEKRCQSRRFCLCQRVSSNLPHTPTVAGAGLTVSVSASELDRPKPRLSLFFHASRPPSVSVSLAVIIALHFHSHKKKKEVCARSLARTSWWTDILDRRENPPSRACIEDILLILWNHNRRTALYNYSRDGPLSEGGEHGKLAS